MQVVKHVMSCYDIIANGIYVQISVRYAQFQRSIFMKRTLEFWRMEIGSIARYLLTSP